MYGAVDDVIIEVDSGMDKENYVGPHASGFLHVCWDVLKWQ